MCLALKTVLKHMTICAGYKTSPLHSKLLPKSAEGRSDFSLFFQARTVPAGYQHSLLFSSCFHNLSN